MSIQPQDFHTLRFVQLYNSFDPGQAIRNVQTELDIFHHENLLFPVSYNESEYHNSYICSFHTAYIDYAREELQLIKSPVQRWLLHKASYLASVWLKMAHINHSVCLNNWLFSTNPLPSLSAQEVFAITHKLVLQNPFHNLTIRSLNAKHNGELIEHLTAQGWLMLPARQVYLFPKNGDWQKRNNVKNDQRLLRKTALTLLQPQEHCKADFKEIEQCFHRLFIDKHSQFNPQYSAQYLWMLHRQNLMEFFSFRDSAGRILATLGVFTENGVMTAPIVGYDTHAQKKLGLYRLVIAQLCKLAMERQLDLNLSSGAGEFKRNRGGEATMEYTALYCRHLPFKQRWLLHSFSKLLNRYAPKLFTENQI
ncbi:GNAT family N-acetyltransferase [Thiomicrorhabdus sp. 6S3-12]|uniref:GNAT family N-acetyltransferase n=1 Tax=Thiomicrorhabdus sp. 6S3-12 TaxID=2819681 RepID=UPI001AACE589|nr:GNAT family N-acetyltransferase [Thiomicrorhabdus sp. 6S3-12]MBO1923288.1 GNAT family N-acetyltransferase [Thiomicrorhabdus sp. 6S3-12]